MLRGGFTELAEWNYLCIYTLYYFGVQARITVHTHARSTVYPRTCGSQNRGEIVG